MKQFQLLAVGGVYVDINCLDFPFGEEGLGVEKEITSLGAGYEMTLGGSALNFNQLCSRLGLASVIVGKVGDDRMGKMLGEFIEAAGVEPALIVDADVATNLGLNFVNPAGRTIILSAGSANQALEAEEVVERAQPLLPEVEYLYLGTCLKLKRLLPAYSELVEQAKATDTKIVIDHGRITNATTAEDMEQTRQLVRHADYYLPSTDEFMELWSATSIEAGLMGRDWGKTQVVVKDGANGAYGLVEGKVVHVPAHDVKPSNTVGAGDAFNAGVIAAVRDGNDLEAAMRFGCATAALKISRPGLPTRAEVEQLAG